MIRIRMVPGMEPWNPMGVAAEAEAAFDHTEIRMLPETPSWGRDPVSIVQTTR